MYDTSALFYTHVIYTHIGLTDTCTQTSVYCVGLGSDCHENPTNRAKLPSRLINNRCLSSCSDPLLRSLCCLVFIQLERNKFSVVHPYHQLMLFWAKLSQPLLQSPPAGKLGLFWTPNYPSQSRENDHFGLIFLLLLRSSYRNKNKFSIYNYQGTP